MKKKIIRECQCGRKVTGKRSTINHGEIEIILFHCKCGYDWDEFEEAE